ncbi:hypothetical protein SBF1_420004 [Candidatus Desulfosporosinus infrequens]|uniref:Uncharacterized protein n=1 Tax=Candidatus Desulfosporosinus infrequens TaxID=2043169 RepID=A0A2U3L9Z1_9FIRM|nr:hypothetical protein SBF1_420004 [Candidatus Desulfosporosinus infrequens]
MRWEQLQTIPPLPSAILKKVFLGNAKKLYNGRIAIGHDGMLISLPAESKTIKTKYLFT